MMNTTININGSKIGPNHPPFIIAEMSGNHNQSFDRALAIAEAAAQAGAHAVKLQTYTADTMTLDIAEREFFINDPVSLWKGRSLYELYKEAYTPWEWHKPIFERCRELGLIYMSTPFDETAVDFLEELNVPAYKVASFELIDLPLLRKIAETGKPIIMSTGMASLAEIDEAVQTVRSAGATQIALLKCTSAYPALPEEANLRTIPHLAQSFDVPAGLSDHTMGTAVAVAAVALGACIVEKHFTLSRKDAGPDSSFSMEPKEFKAMVEDIRTVQKAIGKISYEITEKQKDSRVFRRSLFAVKDIRKGEKFTEENIRSIRPGNGLHTRYFKAVLRKKARKNLEKGTPLKWDFIC